LAARTEVPVATKTVSLGRGLLLRLWCPRVDREVVRRIYLPAVPANDRSVGRTIRSIR
jgi:hypothetical protein